MHRRRFSLDTLWDSQEGNDFLINDPWIAGSANWKLKTYEFQENFHIRNLVEIGERGMLEGKDRVRHYVGNGAEFIPMWRIRRHLGTG